MQEHEKWLYIAKEDLKVAKILFPEEVFGSVAYHCQQSAEKSLKAFLTFKQQPITKTHDLAKLLELCMKIDIGFKKLYEQVRFLNPFATKFRYPTEFDIPDKDDAEIAIKHTKKILQFVLKKIAEPDTGQQDIFEEFDK